MRLDFTGRTPVVTGAAHGFGRAISLAFAARGASVWACDVLEDELAETERLCQAADGTCTVRRVDVRDKNAVDRFVADASQAAGLVHILVNNAGGVLGQVGRPLEEITPTEWQVIYDVNVTGAFYLSQAVAPGMKAARFGRIVNISSGAGLGVSLTGIQAYASAKAAQIGLTRQLPQVIDHLCRRVGRSSGCQHLWTEVLKPAAVGQDDRASRLKHLTLDKTALGDIEIRRGDGTNPTTR